MNPSPKPRSGAGNQVEVMPQAGSRSWTLELSPLQFRTELQSHVSDKYLPLQFHAARTVPHTELSWLKKRFNRILKVLAKELGLPESQQDLSIYTGNTALR